MKTVCFMLVKPLLPLSPHLKGPSFIHSFPLPEMRARIFSFLTLLVQIQKISRLVLTNTVTETCVVITANQLERKTLFKEYI